MVSKTDVDICPYCGSKDLCDCEDRDEDESTDLTDKKENTGCVLLALGPIFIFLILLTTIMVSVI